MCHSFSHPQCALPALSAVFLEGRDHSSITALHSPLQKFTFLYLHSVQCNCGVADLTLRSIVCIAIARGDLDLAGHSVPSYFDFPGSIFDCLPQVDKARKCQILNLFCIGSQRMQCCTPANFDFVVVASNERLWVRIRLLLPCCGRDGSSPFLMLGEIS